MRGRKENRFKVKLSFQLTKLDKDIRTVIIGRDFFIVDMRSCHAIILASIESLIMRNLVLLSLLLNYSDKIPKKGFKNKLSSQFFVLNAIGS